MCVFMYIWFLWNVFGKRFISVAITAHNYFFINTDLHATHVINAKYAARWLNEQ